MSDSVLAAVVIGVPVLAVVAALVALASQGRRTHAIDDENLIDLSCPTCHTQGLVFRVTGSQRLTSGLAGGLLFSRKARAQFECSHCRYFW